MLGFINRVVFGFTNRGDKVIWPPQRDSSADVSSVKSLVSPVFPHFPGILDRRLAEMLGKAAFGAQISTRRTRL